MLNGKRDDMPWLAEKERNDMPSPTGGETTCHDQGGGETTCYDSWERQHALKTWHVISPSPVKHDMSSVPLTHGISSPPRYAWDIISPPSGMTCHLSARQAWYVVSPLVTDGMRLLAIRHGISSLPPLGTTCRLAAC